MRAVVDLDHCRAEIAQGSIHFLLIELLDLALVGRTRFPTGDVVIPLDHHRVAAVGVVRVSAVEHAIPVAVAVVVVPGDPEIAGGLTVPDAVVQRRPQMHDPLELSLRVVPDILDLHGELVDLALVDVPGREHAILATAAGESADTERQRDDVESDPFHDLPP